MMNRRNVLKGIGAGAVVGASGLVAPASANETVNWRFQHFYGSETDQNHGAYLSDIATATGGSVNVSLFRGSEIVPNDQIFDSIKSGIIQMGHGYGGYWPGQVDIGTLESGVPGAWSNIEEAKYIFYGKGGIDLVREAYAEQGVHYLDVIFGSGYELLTKQPVKSLEDLKSMKIRASATMAKVLNKLGISTVYIPTQELYIALSTGTVDGVIYGSPLDYKNMKLFEVAKYYTSMNVLYPGVTENLMVNKTAWDGLSDAQRKSIELASAKFAEDHRNWLVFGSQQVVESGEGEFSQLPREDSMRLVQASQEVWEEEAKRSERNAKFVEILKQVAASSGRL